MANTVIVTPTKDVSNKKEIYTFHWSIANWKVVRNDENLVFNQKIFLEADPSTSEFQPKWEICLKVLRKAKVARVYWKLLEVKRYNSLQKLTAYVRIRLLKSNGSSPVVNETTINQIHLGDSTELLCYPLTIKPRSDHCDGSLIHSDGSVKYSFLVSLEPFKSSMDRFCEKSKQQVCKNLGDLLNDVSSGDLEIITSDGVTILAYKCILKVQCPVFAAMFNSENSESSNSYVKMDDISEKTMKILLQYFYTGDLLPTWRDEDTIVEFTYAAGKYQMVHVLELLDDRLGTEVGLEVGYRHVQLLSLTGNLSLGNAEMKLLEQIKDKVENIEASDELFKLFGIEQFKSEKSNGSGKGENLFGGNVGKDEESTSLGIIDYALGNLEFEEFNKTGLQALALVKKFSMKNVEKILLKRFAEAVSQVKNADDLFAIFGHGIRK